MLCAPSQQQKKNQFNWAANPIIKRNIVILNEMWNQQLLMLIDPCSKWSRALKHLCAIYHFSLVSAYSSILFSASDDENKSSKPLPRSQMGRERKVDKLYLELPQMIAACQPWLLFCVGVGLSVAYEWLKNRLFFFSSCVVNYNIASLSQRSCPDCATQGEIQFCLGSTTEHRNSFQLLRVIDREVVIAFVKENNFNVAWKTAFLGLFFN